MHLRRYLIMISEKYNLVDLKFLQRPLFYILLLVAFLNIPYELNYLKIIVGLITFFLIPGYGFVKIFLNDYQDFEKIIFSFIFGFVFQLLNILILYVFSPFFSNQINLSVNGNIDLLYAQILAQDFNLLIWVISLTTILVIFFTIFDRIYHYNRSKRSSYRFSFIMFRSENFKYLLIFSLILLTSLIIRSIYQTLIPIPATDGALYLDQARSLVETGKFTSKVVGVVGPTFFWNQLGLSVHLFCYFGYAIFFLIGGVSFLSAKCMTVFIGVLLVFIIYELSRTLYDKRIAIVASILVCFHPILIHYSTVVYGPEILGLFFTLCAFLFFLLSSKKSSKKFAIFSGLMTFLALFTAFYTALVFLFSVAFIILLIIAKNKSLFSKLFSLIFFAGTLFVVINATALQSLSHIPLYYWILLISMVFVSLLIAIVQKNEKYLIILKYMSFTIGVFSFFVAIRSFYIFNIVPPSVLHGSQTPSVGGDTVNVVVGMLQNLLSNFVDRIIAYFSSATVEIVSYPVIFFSFLFFLWPRKILKNITVLSYVIFFFVIVIILGGQDNLNWYLYSKLMLYVTPFFILLASFSLVNVCQHLSSNTFIFKISKHTFKTSLSNLFSIFLLLTLVLSFIPSYSVNVAKMNNYDAKSFGIGYYDHMKSTINWIDENTSQNSIIMGTKHYDLAWLTNRTTILIMNLNASNADNYFEMDIYELIIQIHRFKVNYLILEYYNTFKIPAVFELRENPYSFDIAYQTSDNLGRDILVYNVTSISHSVNPFDVIDYYLVEANQFEIEKHNINGYPLSIADSKASNGNAISFQTQDPASVDNQKISLKIHGFGEFTIGIKCRSAWVGSPGEWDTGLSLFVDGHLVNDISLTFPNMSIYQVYELGTLDLNGTCTISLSHTHHTGTYWAWTYFDQIFFYPKSEEWSIRKTS